MDESELRMIHDDILDELKDVNISNQAVAGTASSILGMLLLILILGIVAMVHFW